MYNPAFTLTTSADSITGTANDDVFNAEILTLGADTIDGGDGTDTLNATSNASLTSTTKISNVETVNYTSLGATSIDMTNVTGIDNLNFVDGTGAITLSNNTGAATAFGFSGAMNNTLTAGYKAGTLSGTTDKLVMNLNSAKSLSVTADAGFESAELAIAGTGNTVTLVTAAGATSTTISGTGDANIAANALVSTTDYSITNTAALKFGAITTTDVKTFMATANTGGITGRTALTAPNVYSTDQIDGATTGLTMMLGSGNDNLLVNEQAAANKTNTIKLGAGNDILHVKNAGAGATFVFGEDGDDKIKVDTTALETTDLVSGGAGSDTLAITGNLVNNLVLLGVETVELDSTTGAKTTVSSSDQAVNFVVKAADNDEVDIAGLTAGSSVTVNAASSASGAAAAAKIQKVDVAFATTEASSTIDFNTAVDLTNAATAITTTNITDVTFDFAEIVGAGAAGDIDVNAATALTINSAKDVAFDDILAGSEKLASITVNASDKVTIDDVVNDAKLATVSITAVDNVDLGAIADADALATFNVSSSAGSVAFAEIGDNAGTSTDPDLFAATVSAGTTVTAGIIEADKIGDISMTAANGLLTVTEITSAKDMGTVSLTSTKGAIKVDTGDIVAADTTGITVDMTAKTYINVAGTASGAKADVTNSKGDITATLAGAAAAVVDFTAGTINTAASSGSVNLTASSLTGGLTTTVTSHEVKGSTATSTINLGAKNSSTVNSVTLVGYTSSTTVNGSAGKDTIINSDGGDVLSSPTTNSSDTYAGNGGTDTLSYAGNTHDALSGTDGAGKTTDGYAMNFTGNTITFNNSAVANATNITTLAGNTVAQYDSTATSSTSTTAGNIVAGGETDSVTGFEVVIGSAQADYIAVANTGMTVTGGNGNDKIVLNAGADTVTFSASGSNGKDTVTEFTVNSDTLDLSAMTAGTATEGTEITAKGAAVTTTNRKDFVQVINTAGDTSADVTTDGTKDITVADLTATTLTDVAAFLAEKYSGNSSTTGTDTGVYVINWTSGGYSNSYIYQWDNDTTANAVQAAELTLVGIVTGSAAIDNADITG